MFDLHGQSHRPNAVELGYRLSREALEKTDAQLDSSGAAASGSGSSSAGAGAGGSSTTANTVEGGEEQQAAKCTLDAVVAKSPAVTRSVLVRGKESLGAYLHAVGISSIPSPAIPHCPPEPPEFYYGAYTAMHYAGLKGQTFEPSQIAVGLVSSTQLEVGIGLRPPPRQRQSKAGKGRSASTGGAVSGDNRGEQSVDEVARAMAVGLARWFKRWFSEGVFN